MLIELFKNPNAEFAKLPERFQKRIYRETPAAWACWLWVGSLHYMGRHGAQLEDGEGYGRIWWGGRNALAHRATYEIIVGPIPDGLVLDHVKERCKSRRCVRPDHLEPVTQGENIRRGSRFECVEEAPF